MATSTVESSKLHQEDEPDDMLCTICLELKKDPRLLPCLHSYCKGCLEKILSKSKKPLSCPQCRVDHTTPREGIAGLPQDQVLASTIQAHITKTQTADGKPRRGTGKMVASPRQCTMCTEDDPATSFCSTCGKFLCEFCQKAHKRLVDFRDHKYTPLSELNQVDKLVTMAELPSYCTLHSGEVLKLYCKTCQKVICRDCTIVNHRDHEYGFINELRPQVQEGVETMIARLKARQKEFEAHLAFLKDVETSRNAHADMLEAQITAAFQSYIETLKTRQAELLSIEQASKEGDLKQIWAQKQHIKTTLANLSSAIRYAERLCACPSDKMMLTMQGETTACLNSLQCTTWNASDVEISIPNLFSKTELKLSQAGVLKPDAVSVSMREEKLLHLQVQGYYNRIEKRRETSVPHQASANMYFQTPPPPLPPGAHANLKLGENVCYVIKAHSAMNSCHRHTVPSITITSQFGKDHRISYTLLYHGGGTWSLTFTPPYPGDFTTVVSINKSIEPLQANNIQRFGLSVAQSLATSKQGYPQISQRARVTGALKVGDVVCRGPHWQGGDDDGGVGGLGTVTEFNQTGVQQYIPMGRSRKRPLDSQTPNFVLVKWENGRVGEYKAQAGCFEIELAPRKILCVV